MLWEVEQVRRCAIGTTLAGLVGVVFLCVSFATTHWLALPPGHFYLTNHWLYMGLWSDHACVQDMCGRVPSDTLRTDTNSAWHMILGLMCTTISVAFMGISMNIVTIVSPRKVFAVLTGFFWLLAGAANVVSVVVFWHCFQAYYKYNSWSYWLSMISTISFLAVGITLTIFTCCHRWVTRKTRNEPEDTVTVAPPPVVAYRSDGEAEDGKHYDFNSDPDMQPYTFGGKPYSSNRSGHGNAQSYHI